MFVTIADQARQIADKHHKTVNYAYEFDYFEVVRRRLSPSSACISMLPLAVFEDFGIDLVGNFV